MVLPRPFSSRMQSIRRELECRKHKALTPAPPVTKKTSATPPPLREDAHQRIHENRLNPPREEVRSSTISQSRGIHAPPPLLHSSASLSSPASAPRAPPPRFGSTSVRSTSAAMPITSSHLKPGTRVGVRTRTRTKIDGKTLVLWLAATVVSATDGGYEVIYDGNLPRDNPFSTVNVPLHHVRPFNWSPPPPSQSPTPSAAAIKTPPAPKNPTPRPTTAGKSLRLIRELAPRSTTAGKSLHVIKSLMST